MGADVVSGQAAPEFVGRAADLERLAEVPARLRNGLSAAVIVSGDAGIGKTRLLEQIVHEASDLQAVTFSGYESEVRLGFAALHRLVSPYLGGLADLPEPQRDAIATAFGLAAGPPPNRFLVGLAAMALLERAARQRPLLCVIDDVQWIDQETVDTLAFVARRLDAEGIGLVLGLRGSVGTGSHLHGIAEYPLPPMSEEDMRSLLALAVPVPPAPHVTARLVAESEGNPLALLEYAASLSSERLAGMAALPPALPVSERLAEGFTAQIGQLPGPTRRMLLVLAAAGPDGAAAVPEACARLGFGLETAEPAVRSRIISAQPQLAFRHPLIRSVVYDSAGAAARRDVHALLAQVADDSGFPDSSAWHRAFATSGPDEEVAGQLERTAARARERGGYAAEANFLTLAAQRSAAGTDDHARRLLAAATGHVIAGNGTQAERLLDGYDPAGTIGARIVGTRADAILLGNDARHALVAAMLVNAAMGLPEEETDLARRLLYSALRAGVGSRGHTVGTSLGEVAEALLNRPLPAGRAPAPADLIHEGLAARFALGYRQAGPVMQRALRLLSEVRDFAAAQSVLLLTWLVMEDLWDDEFESATWPRMTAWLRERGALPTVWVGLGSSAITEMRHGNFVAADAMFDEVVPLSVAVGAHRQVSWAVLTEFRAWQGREAETRSMAAAMMGDWSENRRYASSMNFGLMGLTVLDLSLGNYSAALAHARRIARDDPPGHGSRILPDLIEAAIRVGEDGAAGEALDELTSRATTAGTPWALGLLTRSRAVALGGSAEAAAYYEEALCRFAATPLKTEVARTHLLYGEWLRRRRRRRDARHQLAAALTAFTDMGAAGFAQRATAELAATGASPAINPIARPSPLTSQERHVAELAAEGMTNPEISEKLFISESTVDYHLSKVFRKLEITSRRQIRRVLRD